MEDLKDTLNRLVAAHNLLRNLNGVVTEVMVDNKDVLLSLQKDQFLAGQNSKGSDLSPSYLEDDYFTSPQKAQNYARWKESHAERHNSLISVPGLFPAKNWMVPNLIVTGVFYSGLFINIGQTEFELGSSARMTPGITSKFGADTFGLNLISRTYFWNNYLVPVLIKYLNNGMQAATN